MRNLVLRDMWSHSSRDKGLFLTTETWRGAQVPTHQLWIIRDIPLTVS